MNPARERVASASTGSTARRASPSTQSKRGDGRSSTTSSPCSSEGSPPGTTWVAARSGTADALVAFGARANRGLRLEDVGNRVAQVVGEFRRACVALVGVLLEGARQDVVEHRGQRAIDVARRNDGRVHHAEHELREILAPEGRDPREHLVEHDTQGKDVGAVIEGLPGHQLRRHVARRPEHHPGGRLHRRIAQPRDPEIHDLHAAVGQHHDVAGLHVAVDHPALVGDGEGLGDLGRDLHRFRRRERAAADEVAKLAPVEKLHRDEGDVRFAAHVVDRDDGGMADAAGRARLLEEPRLEMRSFLVGAREGDRLDGHRAAQRRILRAVDHAHRPAAQLAQDAEAAEQPGSARGHRQNPRLRRRSRQIPPGLRVSRSPAKVWVMVILSPGSRFSLMSSGG